MDQWDLWMKKVRNNRIACVILAGGIVWLLICSFSLWSYGEEIREKVGIIRDFSISLSSHGVGTLASPFSPLQNTSEKINHGAQKPISPKGRLGNSTNASHGVGNFAPPLSPLQNVSEKINDGTQKSISRKGKPEKINEGAQKSISRKGKPGNTTSASHGVGSLAPPFSPLQNVAEKINHGAQKSISREGRRRNNTGASHDSEDSNHLHQSKNSSLFAAREVQEKTNAKAPTGENAIPPVQCDIYSGKWVRDYSYPLYPAGECRYMSPVFDCKANGRRDSGYTNWRWQPRDCNLPRLNATEMLERLRGKRIMFIGDSINHSQWESLLCILGTAVPDDKKYLGGRGAGVAYVAKDYNLSVEFHWAPFLVEQGSIEFQNQSRGILRLHAIEKHGANWKDVDILVFNSGHWWTHGNKAAAENFFQEGDYLHPQLDPLAAFEKGLTTWANWIDHNVNATKTRVFFRGFSPMHFSSRQWNKKDTHKCNFETEPIMEESFVTGYPERMQTVEKVLGRMQFPVSLLNITRLSDFRKDAHTSVYTLKGNKKLTREQRNHPDQFGDCSHWCLPGLPDIWNELLYGSLVLEGVTTSPHSLSH